MRFCHLEEIGRDEHNGNARLSSHVCVFVCVCVCVCDRVPLKVNKLTSTTAQFPMDYFALPFCEPEGGLKSDDMILGEWLTGDRIESTPYILRFKEDMYCEKVCVSNLGRAEARDLAPNKVINAVRKDYHINFVLDNLSAASKLEDEATITTRYWGGVPIGFKDKVTTRTQKSHIYNHFNFEVWYHREDDVDPKKSNKKKKEKYHIVRFLVEPLSIRHNLHIDPESGSIVIDNPIESCAFQRSHTSFSMTQKDAKPQEASGKVLFTYDVIWIENGTWGENVAYADRWDVYITMAGAIPALVFWAPFFGSLVLLLLLMVAAVCVLVNMLQLQRSRIAAAAAASIPDPNGMGSFVFRTPAWPLVFSVACGTGAQLLWTAMIQAVLCSMNVVGPSNRGSTLTSLVVLWFSMGGLVGGYVTGWLYASFVGTDDDDNYKSHQVVAAQVLSFPGLVYVCFLVYQFLAMVRSSTAQIPLVTHVVLLVMWFGVMAPCAFFGERLACRRGVVRFPGADRDAERAIPRQPCYANGLFLFLVSTIVPFLEVFVVYYFLLEAFWRYEYFGAFGALLAVMTVCWTTSAVTSLLFCQLQLQYEDYRWWWRAFANGGAFSVNIFLYSLVYYRQLGSDSWLTLLVFVGFMLLFSVAILLMGGYLSVMTSLWFNRKMYLFSVDEPASEGDLLLNDIDDDEEGLTGDESGPSA